MTQESWDHHQTAERARKQETENLRQYVDTKIRYWHGELKKRMEGMDAAALSPTADFDAVRVSTEKAISYIDAYQTLRHDLLGGVLPDE